jgi:hypothetical protein
VALSFVRDDEFFQPRNFCSIQAPVRKGALARGPEKAARSGGSKTQRRYVTL